MITVRFITEAHSMFPYFFDRVGFWPLNVPPPDGSIFVYDTEKRESEKILVDDWAFDDYMGIFKSKTWCGLVMLSLKEARLHEYVKEMHFRHCKPGLPFSDEDSVVVRNMRTTREIDNKRAIAINTCGVRIEPLGVQGSVVAVSDKSGDMGELKSLYGMFGSLCETTGVNLLSYERIRIYSATRRCELVIHLSQTQDAKRFFGKMSLDIYG